MHQLKGKTAVVTGAASGIGAATAAAFATAGMNVVLADIMPEQLKSVYSRLKSDGANVEIAVTDVSDADSVERLARTSLDRFGAIDVAFNNAGVAMHGTPLADLPLNDWRWVIDVNILGVVHCIKAFVPVMRASGREGHIVNTASIGGFQVNRRWLTGAYSMTKYAVVAISEALENELEGTPIGVSVLCPGSVATNLANAQSRPDRLGGSTERAQQAFLREEIANGTPPADVAERVIRAVVNNDFYIFTDTAALSVVETRHRRIEEAMRAIIVEEDRKRA